MSMSPTSAWWKCNRGGVLGWRRHVPTRGEVSGSRKQELHPRSPFCVWLSICVWLALNFLHLDLQDLSLEAYPLFPAVVLIEKMMQHQILILNDIKHIKHMNISVHISPAKTATCQTISSAMNFEWKWLPRQNSVPPFFPCNFFLLIAAFCRFFLWKDLCLNINQGDKDVETVRWEDCSVVFEKVVLV